MFGSTVTARRGHGRPVYTHRERSRDTPRASQFHAHKWQRNQWKRPQDKNMRTRIARVVARAFTLVEGLHCSRYGYDKRRHVHYSKHQSALIFFFRANCTFTPSRPWWKAAARGVLRRAATGVRGTLPPGAAKQNNRRRKQTTQDEQRAERGNNYRHRHHRQQQSKHHQPRLLGVSSIPAC